MLPIMYNLKSLTTRKGTAIATIAGVALVSAVLAASLMLAAGAEKTVASSGRDDVAVVLRRGSDSELSSSIDVEALGTIRSTPGISAPQGRPLVAAELVVVLAMPKSGGDGFSNVVARGVDEISLAIRPNVHLVRGRMPAPGSEEALVGQRILGRFEGLSEGQTLELRPQRTVRIVGVMAADGDAVESEVWIPRSTLQGAFGRGASVSSVRVRLEDPDRFTAFAHTLESDKRLTVHAAREPDFLEAQSENLALFIRVMGTVIAVLFSVGAMIGATITMHGAVAYRRREIGTLRALGFSRWTILAGFLFEAIVLTATGGAVGAILALGLSTIEISMVNYATWSELVFSFTPTPTIILTSVLFAAVVGMVGGFIPALRAAFTSPLAAIRS